MTLQKILEQKKEAIQQFQKTADSLIARIDKIIICIPGTKEYENLQKDRKYLSTLKCDNMSENDIIEAQNNVEQNIVKYIEFLEKEQSKLSAEDAVNLCLEYKKTVDKLKINVECHEREIKDWLDVMAYVLKEGKQRFTACHTAKRFRHAANLIKNALKESKLPNLCEVRSIIYNDPMEIPPSIMLTSKQQNTR